MITKLEARGYRCLKDVSQALLPRQVLVGPNGSGKSAFLDVIAFLGDVVSKGLREAVELRTNNFYDLVWGRENSSFDLAVEARTDWGAEIVRYEAEFQIDANDAQPVISKEVVSRGTADRRSLVYSRSREVAIFQDPKSGNPLEFNVFRSYSVLNVVGEQPFWLTGFLRSGVITVALDNSLLRQPTAPGQGNGRQLNGHHLTPGVGQLRESPSAFRAWINHVQTAIPDLVDIRMIVRPEDRHRYLMIKYAGDVEVPQWMVSDGTLRLLALTILAYIPDFNGVYLVEEPEIGLHPTAIETVWQSLSSVYSGQVLITSHSPILLGLARPEQLLCFQRPEEGTAIISGADHPLLKDWRSGVNVSDLFAAGVLG